MEKDQKDQRNQNQSGNQNQSSNQNQYGKKDESGNQNKSGVPSNRKSPEEEENKKEPMPKSPTMDNDKNKGSQHGNMEHKDSNKANPKARVANVDGPEEDMIDDTEEGNLYEEGTAQGMEDGTRNEKTRKGGM